MVTGKARAVDGQSNHPPRALELDVRNPAGRTPLHYAAVGGHRAVVGLLLDAGTTIDLPDGQGDTALLMAAFHGHEPVVRLLLDRNGTPAGRHAQHAVCANVRPHAMSSRALPNRQRTRTSL